MINPFRQIKSNSRYTYNDKTIVVERVKLNVIVFYDLLEWWKYQPIIPKYQYMKKWDFIINMKKYKFK